MEALGKLSIFLTLRSIPNIVFGLNSLKDINLSGCFKVLKNPRTDTSENAAQSQSTPSIFTWIRSLYPSSHKDFAAYFMPSLCSLYCLREVDISFCSLSQLPDAIGCLHLLEKLNLGGNNFVKLPSLKELSKLVYLNLEHCKLLESLPKLSSPASVKHDYHMLSSNIKYWIAGLYIFNCPKLGKRECCSNTVFSWMIQFIQSNQGSSAFFRWIDIGIVIPGSEIPSWFNNQSKGSSISMDPSPIMHDNGSNFIGVACCAVFSVVLYVPATVTCAWKCRIGLGFSNNDDGRYVYIPVNIEKGLDVKSNHVWLIYFTRDSFFSVLSLTDKTSCNIKMETRTVDGHGLDLWVKNCVHRWIYKEDLHQMHCFGNSLAKKGKFLAIEDEAEPQSFISSNNKS